MRPPQGQHRTDLRRQLYLCGTVPLVELNSHLQIHSVDADARKEEIRRFWRGAAAHFESLVARETGIAETIDARPLSKQEAEAAVQISRQKVFQDTFANFPWRFEEVEIDKIVASQRQIDLDFVEDCCAAEAPSGLELLNHCLAPGGAPAPVEVSRTAQAAYTFASDHPGFGFLGVTESTPSEAVTDAWKLGGQVVRAVTMLVGFPISTINVYRVGARRILNNGFHRLFALRRAGLTHAPVLCLDISNPEIELPPTIADLPTKYLTTAERPAILRDFADEKLTAIVCRRATTKFLQLGWQTVAGAVPRAGAPHARQMAREPSGGARGAD